MKNKRKTIAKKELLGTESISELGMVEYICNPGKLRQEDQKFKAGLGNM